MNPTTSLAPRDLKNEPCPQSWKMIKIRTKNAPAKAASGIVNQYDTERLRYIRYQSRPYGTMVFTICQRARPREGCWYLATISFQGAVSVALLVSVSVELGSFDSVI